MEDQGLYIQLFSIHGLVRGHDWEMGRNADTGGQIKYVVELARALGKEPRVRKVDLFTRRIQGKEYSPDYGQSIEQISDKVRIVRIQCGGSKYIRKELLWPHLFEFVDKTVKFIKQEDDVPNFVHGHYADGGYVAKELANLLNVPFLFTGHSLGRPKQERLRSGGMSDSEINRQFNIDQRIQVEESIIAKADLIITSTNQEVEQQYGMYDNFSKGKYAVVPPGIENDRFFPFYQEPTGLTDAAAFSEAEFYVQQELKRFFSNPDKPLILALSRPARRKNVSGLMNAYGSDKELQAMANLAVFVGIRKDINLLDENEREVLTELLLLMDKFDLYGNLAIPKKADVGFEVPSLYRLAAKSGGVFINPAFTEPFGLTLIEAASCGLPIVATDDGGPRDILRNCENGSLIDVYDHQDIVDKLKELLVDREKWRECSKKGIEGVEKHYLWQAHCQKFLDQLQGIPVKEKIQAAPAISSSRLAQIDRLFITDIDDTLIGDDDALAQLSELIIANRDRVGFGVATGRPLSMVQEIIEEKGFPHPDIIISSVGTEIYYGENLLPEKGWSAHISKQWKPRQIKKTLERLDFLEPQDKDPEKPFKLSYFLEEGTPEQMTKIHQVLSEHKIRYSLIYSRSLFLDVIPFRASKGKAIRYLGYKWSIPLRKIAVSGDSGNDEDMLRGEMLGIVVGNHHHDLDKLKGLRNIFFAQGHYAAGIREGLEHYRFFNFK